MSPLLVLLLLASTPEEAPAPPPEPTLEAATTGYLDTRFTGARASDSVLFSPTGVPALANLTEGNLQVRLRYAERASLGADASLFWQGAGFFQGRDAEGESTWLEPQDVPLYRPSVVLSELYAAYEVGPHLHLTLGKKRVVWGSGMALNPTDLLNPPKDPTDPANQRAGAWLARVELPFDSFTFSVVGAAKVLRQYAGLPTALLTYPSYPTAEAAAGLVPDDRDDEPHYALAARLYALVADTDVTLTYHFTHLYNDAFRNKSRAGLSLSRVFGATEVHAEALLQTGSSRLYVPAGCAGGSSSLAACVQAGTAPVQRALLEDEGLRPKVLVGLRHLFEDSAMLSAEYYFNGEGYSRQELSRYAGLLVQAQALLASQPQLAARLPDALSATSGTDPGSPQKFVFEPLRRHYLFLTYSKPQVADDWTLGASAVLNVSDLSGQLIPQVTWSAREWLSLSASLFVPLPGVESLGFDVEGTRLTEAALSPSDWRGLLSARLFF